MLKRCLNFRNVRLLFELSKFEYLNSILFFLITLILEFGILNSLIISEKIQSFHSHDFKISKKSLQLF